MLLKFSLWELQIPSTWISSRPDIISFLRRETPVSALPKQDPFRLLMELQRCVSFEHNQANYSLIEVKEIFLSLAAEWYRIYYSHPLWDRLRNGNLTQRGLLSWILRTYHLSRSAGVTAARCAVFSSNQKVRQLFLLNSLEEFSHCESYYFPIETIFPVSSAQAKQLVPLSANIAFDQQMLAIAERDWLAHIFVAVFQELSAGFSEMAESIYSEIEKVYQLGNYFDGWRKHNRLDNKLNHAGHFLSFFEMIEQIPNAQLCQSILCAGDTVSFLIGTLDQILIEDTLGPISPLRNPISLSTTTKSETSLLYTLNNELPVHFWLDVEMTNLVESLATTAVSSLVHNFDWIKDFENWLSGSIVPSLVRALSFCSEQDEILTLGDILISFQNWKLINPELILEHVNIERVPARIALENAMQELASRPRIFLTMLGILYDIRLAVSEKCSLEKLSEQALLNCVTNRLKTWFQKTTLSYEERIVVLNHWVLLVEMLKDLESGIYISGLGGNPFGRMER